MSDALMVEEPASDASSILTVEGLRIARASLDKDSAIVSSFDLVISQGETVGIVGESGSGKSMTVRAMIGLLPPNVVASGRIVYDGKDLLKLNEREWRAIRGREIGMVMQDPFTTLNPLLRCGRIIEESLQREFQGISRRGRRREEAIRRLAEVGITDAGVADRYPFQLSGGMRQRVGIAAALARDPNLLIADEPSTALDSTTQRETLALLRRVQRTRGMSLVLITHDLRLAFAMCDRIYVLYAGSLVEVAPAAELEAAPLHPYTTALLLSEPPADRKVRELVTIPGVVPRPSEVAGGCVFAPRCPWAHPICVERAPELRTVSATRLSACVRLPQIQAAMHARRSEADFDHSPAIVEVSRDELLRVQDMKKVYRNGTRRVVALNGVSLSVREDETVCVVGESGSGKTTLARLLVGLDTPTAGTFHLDGERVTNWAGLDAKTQRRLRGIVQYVFQDPYSSLNPMRTVGASLSEAIRVHDPSSKNVEKRVSELLRSVGIPPNYAERKPAVLSGGERQRVAIARVLAVEPKLIICDEPVSALDVSVQAQILNLLISLRRERGISYLFITHDLSIVRQIADSIHVMHRGVIVEHGMAQEVLDRPKHPYTKKLIAAAPQANKGWLESADENFTAISSSRHA